MKKIFMIFIILLQFALGSAGIMELVWFMSGRESTMNPFMSGLSALVFYALGIRNLLTLTKEKEQ